MKRTRANFKSTLRKCKLGNDKRIADSLASTFLNKDCKAFWRDIRTINVKDSPVSCSINGVSGHEAITKVWQPHFSNLLNSIQFQFFISRYITQHIYYYIITN